MSYTIEKLSGEPIILGVGNADFTGEEGPQLIDDLFAVIDSQTERVYMIADMLAVTLTMDDLLEGSNNMTRGQKPIYTHPNIIENVFVTTSMFLKLATKGLSSPLFGALQIKVVDTREEALAYCRAKIAGG